MKDDHQTISDQLAKCKKENNELQERMLQLDCYIRWENLKFSGIVEDRDESVVTTQKKLREFFVKSLGVDQATTIDFQRCHRMGSRSEKGQTCRDIIARFARFQDREDIWKRRGNLKGSKFFIKEDFPSVIDERRNKLYPILKAARQDGKKAHLVADKLILEGKRYTVEMMDQLPVNLQPESLSTRVLDDVVLFYGADSNLSNFYRAQFVVGGKIFSSSEQYYQFRRANHIGNLEIASSILATDDPVEQRRLGRRLESKEESWNDIKAEEVMEEAVKEKFQQNPNLLRELISTSNKQLVECNVHDTFWGSGIRLDSDQARDRSKWKGKNVMGNVLHKVRDCLKINYKFKYTIFGG